MSDLQRALPGSVGESASAATTEVGLLRGLTLDAVPVGMVIHGTSGAIVFSNRAAERLLGLTREQIEGRTSMDPRWRAVAEDLSDLPGESHPAMVCLRTAHPVHDFVMGVHQPDGQLRWMRVDAVPLCDEAGGLRGVSATFRDITEERVLAQELQRVENRLELARRAGRVGLWEWHIQTDAVCHDHAFSEVTNGLRPTTREDWLDAIHAEDRDRVARLVQDAAAAGRGDITYRIVGPDDGQVRWLVSHADVVERNEDGTPSRLAGSIVDATAVQAANAQVGHLLDCMTDGYLALSRDFQITFANEQAAAFLSRCPDDLVGAHLWAEFPDALGTVFERQYEIAMGGESVEFEAFYEGLAAWVEVRAHPIPEGIALYFRDVTDKHRVAEERERLLLTAERAREELAHAATHDSLTNLPNRAALATWLACRLGDDAGGELTLLFVDLDRFKRINDSHGHAEGDALLAEASRRLTALVPVEGMVARLGGDEFIIAVPKAVGVRRELAERVLDAFRHPFEVGSRRVLVTASVGVVSSSPRATPETLVRDADAALYQAKDAGRDCVAVFDEEVRRQIGARLAIESDLRAALQNQEIRAQYQPIFDVRTGTAVGVEALARWQHMQRGWVSPGEFIPVAEETGLVLAIGDAMLDSVGACYERINRSLEGADAVAWVNVSGRHLEDPSFAGHLIRRVERSGLMGRIGLEITETALARDNHVAEGTVHRLAAAGFLVAIDDFGTGYSSLARLAQYPVHMLKIDRSFVEALSNDAGVLIVSAIVDLAHAIGADACAEGVETPEQLAILADLRVDKVSGYYLCRPAPIEDLASGVAVGRSILAAGSYQSKY